MANQEVYLVTAEVKNGSGGSDDGRTYSWSIAQNGGTRTGIPPGSGETTPGSFIQTSTGSVWKFRVYFNFSSVNKLTRTSSRIFNFHIVGGYPGYNSPLANSPSALDIFPSGATDNNGVLHSNPFIQMTVQGGGSFQTDSGSGTPGPSNDGWYHGMAKHWFAKEITFATDYFVDFEMCFSPDPTVGSIKADTATGGVSTNWIPFQHIPTYCPAGAESGGASGFSATSGQMWFQLLEGTYEATGGGSNGTLQDKFSYLKTMSQWGTSTSAMIGDTSSTYVFPLSGLGNSSPLPGSGAATSSFVDNHTTVSDAGYTSGGASGGGSPAPPSSIALVASQFQGTDNGTVSFATATGKTEAQIKALMETANPNHKYEIHTFTDGSKFAMCERPLAGAAPPANWWVASN